MLARTPLSLDRTLSNSSWTRLARVMESKWLGGSVVAWLAIGVTLVGNAITYGATVATIQGRIATLEYTVSRNRDESLERIKSLETSVSSIYNSIYTLNNSIKIDVEVIKEQIKSVNGALQRMERDGRRGPPPSR